MPLTLIRQPAPNRSPDTAPLPASGEAPRVSPAPQPPTPDDDAPPEALAPSILPAFAMNLPAAKWINGFPPRRRAGLSRAQAAWLTRQVTLDPRLALYSSQISADELYHAMCVFRSLFDRAASAEVNLRAALDWASVLVDAADAAERTRAVSPLPYLWMPSEELDAAQAEEQAANARSRRRSRPKA